MQPLDVYFCSELNHMSERHRLFSVSDEECLCHKRCILVENLWLKKPMKISSLVVGLQIASAFEMVRIGVVHFLLVFIEYLELEEVDSLLKEIDISEVLHVKHKLSSSPVHFVN